MSQMESENLMGPKSTGFGAMLELDRSHKFQWGSFIHASIIHYFSLVIIGPFVAIYALCEKYLMFNFAFTQLKVPLLETIFQWAAILLYIYTTFWDTGDVGDYAGIALISVLTFLRATVIGAKYGSFGSEYWNTLRTEKIPYDKQNRRNTAATWLKDDKKFILLETLATEERQNLNYFNLDQTSEINFLSNSHAVQLPETVNDYTEQANKLGEEYKLTLKIENNASTAQDSP